MSPVWDVDIQYRMRCFNAWAAIGILLTFSFCLSVERVVRVLLFEFIHTFLLGAVQVSALNLLA